MQFILLTIICIFLGIILGNLISIRRDVRDYQEVLELLEMHTSSIRQLLETQNDKCDELFLFTRENLSLKNDRTINELDRINLTLFEIQKQNDLFIGYYVEKKNRRSKTVS